MSTEQDLLVEKIDAILPQTQCTKCGFDGCLPYAKAVAAGQAHNLCPPGGEAVIAKLAKLLDRPIQPLNPEHGQHEPRKVAVIREDECIGCTKCIQACPVDAIIGSAKKMHTVLTEECTGCELCVRPCPVDCIDLEPAPKAQQPDLLTVEQQQKLSDYYRWRHNNRNRRLQRQAAIAKQKHDQLKKPNASSSTEAKKAYIAQAIARAKAKKPDKQ